MIVEIIKVISLMLFVAGINLAFKDAASRRQYKNLQSTIYDSTTIARYDSLIAIRK